MKNILSHLSIFILAMFALTGSLFSAVPPPDAEALAAVSDFYGANPAYGKFKASLLKEWEYDDVSRPTEARRPYQIAYEKSADGVTLTLYGVITYEPAGSKWKHRSTQGTASKVEGLPAPKKEELSKALMEVLKNKPGFIPALGQAVFISNFTVDPYNDSIELGLRFVETGSTKTRVFTLSFVLHVYGSMFKTQTVQSSRSSRTYEKIVDGLFIFQVQGIKEKSTDAWRLESAGPAYRNSWSEASPEEYKDYEFSPELLVSAGVKTLSNAGLAAVTGLKEADYQKLLKDLKSKGEELRAAREAEAKKAQEVHTQKIKALQEEWEKLLTSGKWNADAFAKYLEPDGKPSVKDLNSKISKAKDEKSYKLLGSTVQEVTQFEKNEAGEIRARIKVERQFERFKKNGPVYLSSGKGSKSYEVRWKSGKNPGTWYLENLSEAFEPLD